jgi:hypothetical protein
MITFQEQLGPATSLSWKFYEAPASVDWLHTESRQLESEDQIAPSKGPRTVIPSAIFSISAYVWSSLEW